MNSILTVLGQLDFLNTLWLFFLVFVLHEFEEWNIDRFERRNFVGLPSAATDKSARLWIAFIVVVGLVWCAVATLPGNPTIAAWVILPAITMMLQNALQHTYWSFYFRQYAPGAITSTWALGASLSGSSFPITGRNVPLAKPANSPAWMPSSSAGNAFHMIIPKMAASRIIAARGLISTVPRQPMTTIRPNLASTVRSLSRLTLESISRTTSTPRPPVRLMIWSR